MISAENFTLYNIDRKKIFGPLSFKIKEGAVTIIHGKNGSGKTSLLNYFVHKRGFHTGKFNLARKNINFSYLPQTHCKDDQSPTRVKDLLDAFKVSERHLSREISEDLLWRTCSGGEKQRILLDIVLNRPADILLLDEPLNNLDESSKDAFWNSIETVLIRRVIGALAIVSHEAPSISEYEKVYIK